MKDSLLKDKLIKFLSVEYTAEESKEQLDNAKVRFINLVEIEYDNGKKDLVIKDEEGNFVVYEKSEEQFSIEVGVNAETVECDNILNDHVSDPPLCEKYVSKETNECEI